MICYTAFGKGSQYKPFPDNMQSKIWDYFENQLMPTVYYPEKPTAEEEERNIFVKIADCLIEGCENLSKLEV